MLKAERMINILLAPVYHVKPIQETYTQRFLLLLSFPVVCQSKDSSRLPSYKQAIDRHRTYNTILFPQHNKSITTMQRKG